VGLQAIRRQTDYRIQFANVISPRGPSNATENNEMRIAIEDPAYTRGLIGVRMADTHALFDDFTAKAS
jgi:hypothetical protein